MKELAKSLLFDSGDSTVVRECRRCGTSVSSTVQSCPQCDSEDIVEYLIQ